MPIMMLPEFKSEVEKFLSETGVAPSRLGREALNDPGFVSGLRSGMEPREGTRSKVREKMQELRKAMQLSAA
ncbi:hypothetical protein VWZ82_12910 [Phaeobacter sp. JH20_41]|uniref:hypothetical protein n=1 Tax=Phaeobacter TaxID=302485 RepID=UPI000422686B|nr:hypothetical protein [Phaeobacter gallaeciensis]